MRNDPKFASAKREATRRLTQALKQIGGSVRRHRVAAGFSLRDAAAVLGVSDVKIGEVERGKHEPDLAYAQLLIGFYRAFVERKDADDDRRHMPDCESLCTEGAVCNCGGL